MKWTREGFDLVRKIKSSEMNSVMSSDKVWLSSANILAIVLKYRLCLDLQFSS
jgi:hypothetical protein